jgi:adenosine kinase
MPDKIHILNVSFTVNSVIERPGGTAGNIAYALRLLGERPTIMATVGHDHHRYFKWLEIHDISKEGVRIIEEEFTASAYITTDQADNQITAFNPGAMKHASEYDLSDVGADGGLAIIAAGNLDDMVAYRDLYRAKGIDFVFDPAQSLPMWETAALARCLDGARVLISNDYELEMIMKSTGLDKGQLLERTGAIITTKGEAGSVVVTREGETTVPPYKLSAPPVDPTGAGDAYRGGLVRGMVAGKDLVECARFGSICASFAVEVQGTQSYTFTNEEFTARYRATYDV